MSNTTLAKATIINKDKPAMRVECMFNPKEYTITKQNKWTEAGNSGSNMPQLEFTNGQPATLKMQLFFDTYAQGKDVRSYTNKLWEMMMVDPDLPQTIQGSKNDKTQKYRPPVVLFQWGETVSFEAVITNITQKFLLFLDKGTPVRATLDVTFQQASDPNKLPMQNPTSGGAGGERVWTVTAGDTLIGIAYRVYGDSNKWRRIAEANRLTQVRRLAPGTVLVIPNV